ncbi:uncharacterized protein LOC105182503 isoform X2 [Harpegnathos saltator]|uniref:uncharacterized protein LOC105182503 isoform X2 n=1 Tax=Harpegnathos saltator TaxID=610380 RepID=UPI000DBEDDD5|nr:uncharacterized protein LOC105182503 isoform X2 [Harpegnathos saltator]
MRTSSSSLPRKRKRKDLSPLDTVLRVARRPAARYVAREPPRADLAVSHRTSQRILRHEGRREGGPSETSRPQERPTSDPLGERRRRRRGQGAKEEVLAAPAVRTTAHIVRSVLLLLALLCAQCCLATGEALAGTQKYCTRTVKTRYGILRGVEARSSTAVETYYGVPYATPPLGALRYMPPVTPTPWRGTKFADTMPPACPQRPPEPDTSLPRRRRAYLERLAPILANQSEDCLYLNLYVPKPPHGSIADSLPTVLLIHGDSYSWGAGNSFDGTALAAHGRLIVVSINFRLGVLGFLKTGSKGSAQGNYGLMDLVAGLHWLRENLGAFGGDPERLALLGHGTGAALANFLAVSPMAKELIGRVILLGGSALSPWAVQRDPLTVKRRVADQTGCPSDVEADDIAPCLRLRSLEELLAVKLDPPRFTSGFAPFVDGAVLPPTVNQPTASSSGLMPIVPGPGAEFADFGNRDLLFGLTSEEAWLNLSEDDLQNGLNETRRDRILRTYVRNTYRYHLHEIYSTLRNEYTDWERGEQSPVAICDGLLSLLGDGQVAAPLLRLALLHSASAGRGYFLHFQPDDRPSQKGEEVPYLLGIPLLRGELTSATSAFGNYTTADENLSKLLVHYLANFVRRGSWLYLFCARCHGRDDTPSWEPKGWRKACPQPFCPTYRKFARILCLFLLGLLLWGVAYSVIGDDAAPGGPLFGLASLCIAAHFGGWLISLTTLPALIGMLVTGLILQNTGLVQIGGEYAVVVSNLRKIALVIILTRAGLDLDPNALKRLRLTVPKLGLIPWVVEATVVAALTTHLLGLPWIWGFLLGSIIAAVSPAVVVPCLFRLRAKGYGVAKGIPTLIIAVAGIDDAASVAVHGIVKSVMFSHDALWYQILQGPIAIIGGLGFGIMWGWLAKYVPEKGDPFMVPLRVLMLLGGGLLAVFGSEAIELGGAGPLAVVAAAFVSCYFWQQEGWEVDDNPVATSFEIFWMIFEPILFGITGTQIKINELDGKTVYLGLGCLIAGIVIRIAITVLVGIGSNLNLKEKVFIALSWMAKATVQAALGPSTLDEVDKDDGKQVEYAETVLTLCVLSILLTAPAGAIIISLSGPKLLTKTNTPVPPPEAWKTRRPSIRDISIINEDPDLEETANERKP